MRKIELSPDLFNSWFFGFYKCQSRFIHTYGGSGSGKSYCVAQKLIVRLIKEDTLHRFLCVRKTRVTIKKSMFEQVLHILTHWGMRSDFEINLTELSITYKPTGSQFVMVGLDDPEKLKSIVGVTGIWIEEATQLEEKDFNELNRRLRGITKYYKQIVFSYNPIDAGHWIVKRFFKEQNDNVVLFKSTYLDNKFIDQEYADQLNELVKHSEYEYAVYCRGEWGTLKAENAFMSTYDPNKHESKLAVFDPGKPLYLVVDFNLNPMALNWVHMWEDDKGEHIHFIDEMDITQASIPKTAERILQSKYAPFLQSIKVTGDRTGEAGQLALRDNATQWEQLRRALDLRKSQQVVPVNPRHRESRVHCNYILSYHPDFKINPETCPSTARDMKIVQCDRYGKIIKSDRKKIEQQADHLDNVRYFVNAFMRRWIDRDSKNNRRAQILAKLTDAA